MNKAGDCLIFLSKFIGSEFKVKEFFWIINLKSKSQKKETEVSFVMYRFYNFLK